MHAPGARTGTRWLKPLQQAVSSGTDEQRALALDLMEEAFLDSDEAESARQQYCNGLATADMGRMTKILERIAADPTRLPRNNSLGVGNVPCGLCKKPPVAAWARPRRRSRRSPATPPPSAPTARSSSARRAPRPTTSASARAAARCCRCGKRVIDERCSHA